MAEIIRLKAPGGVEQFELADLELPPPAADEIRLSQTAIGVNFIDIYQRLGLYGLPPAGIPGVEAVGKVTAIGSNVTSVKVGERIAYAGAVGAYASARNLPAWRAVKIPDQLPDEAVASSFVKGITAYMLLHRVFPVGAGAFVLVHSAAGGLGQLLTRWAVRLGAQVIGTVGSAEKAEIAGNAGAHHVIIGRDADFARAVAEVTAGRGVDVAYDGVGGTTLGKTLACVRPFGVVASIGQSGGPIPPLDVNDLGPRRSIVLARPSVMAFMTDAGDYHRAAEAVLEKLIQGELGSVSRSYPLREAGHAHDDLEAGHTTGALLLKP